jgi:PAS domain S-box-containing protein
MAPADTPLHSSTPADPNEALLALRARAETRRHLVTQVSDGHKPEEVQRLVQELQVHQIELEMQYEELLLAQAEAQAARAEYVDLYEFAPVGYFSLTDAGTITQLNLCASKQLGSVRQRLQGRRFALFVAPARRLEFGQFLARVLRSETTQSLELELQREDGTYFHAQLEGLRVDGLTGPQCRLAVLDVTSRHRATQALAASEARFRKLFADSNDAVVLLQGHCYVDCNEAAVRLLGASGKAAIVGRPAWDHTPEFQPDGRRTIDLFHETTQEAIRTGSKRCEALMRKATGEEIWVEAVLTPIELGGPAPVVHILWRDVTAARAAAAALRTSQERLELALSASETGIFTWEPATDRIEGDARFLAAFGLPDEGAGVILPQVLQRVHPADRPRFAAATEAALRGGAPLVVDCRVVWADGSVHYVSAAGRLVSDVPNQPPSFAGVLRDVTAIYTAEEEVRESRERLQLALEASASGVWEWEVASHQLAWDARAQAIFGLEYNPEPVSFEVLRAAVHPDDLVGVAAGLQRALEEGGSFDLEHRICWPNGQVRYVAAQGKVIHADDGQPLRLTGIMRDVTSRREAANALRREKEFTESLLENTVDGIIALDRTLHIIAWNAEAARYFGREASEALGQPLFGVLPYLDEVARQAVRQVLAGQALTRLGHTFRNRPGSYDVFGVPLLHQDEEPTGALFIVRDVTERNQLAEEATQMRLRRQQEVLAAILTTQETERKRIAEALHNGLGQLLYATKLSLERRNGPAAPQEALKLLDDAIRTTRTISFELTPGILDDFGLRTALEELVKRIVRARLPARLHEAGLDERLPPQVEIAVYRIVQELLNNVMKHAAATEVEVHVVREGCRLAVSVEDNGCGFEPEALATQPLGGIGLSGVRNRVALLGGELSIKSRLGQGTIVSFELNV